jgi:hypothetical protein
LNAAGVTMGHSNTGDIIFILFAVFLLIPMQFAVLYILGRAFPGAIKSILQQLPTPKARRMAVVVTTVVIVAEIVVIVLLG